MDLSAHETEETTSEIVEIVEEDIGEEDQSWYPELGDG